MTIARKCSIGNHEKCLVGHWCECECHKKQKADTQPTQSDSLDEITDEMYQLAVRGNDKGFDRKKQALAAHYAAKEQEAVKNLYSEVKENIDYIVSVEGIEIPQVWQDKILQPLDFAIADLTNQLNQLKGDS